MPCEDILFHIFSSARTDAAVAAGKRAVVAAAGKRAAVDNKAGRT